MLPLPKSFTVEGDSGIPTSLVSLLLTFDNNLDYCRHSTGGEMSGRLELLQGTLDLLVLKILALEPAHGWAIAQRIQQISSEVLQVGQGSLYPALHRLEKKGWIDAEWAISEAGRRAKYYSLSRAGRKQMERELAEWERFSAAVTAIVQYT
jgi:PadR family transcriptional regulator PadR